MEWWTFCGFDPGAAPIRVEGIAECFHLLHVQLDKSSDDSGITNQEYQESSKALSVSCFQTIKVAMNPYGMEVR